VEPGGVFHAMAAKQKAIAAIGKKNKVICHSQKMSR
jgi:hypothetical protein